MVSVSGVFEVEEDDGVEEMMMEPQEQLKHRLKQLTDAVISQSTETRGKHCLLIMPAEIRAGLLVHSYSDQEPAGFRRVCRKTLF